MSKRKRNKRRRNAKSSSTQRSVRAPAVSSRVIRNRGVLRTLRIKHKEFVTDVEIPTGTGVFEKFEVNPGLSTFFPWLSQIAQRFESYYFNSFKLHYVSSVSTDTSGSLAICPDYDAADNNTLASKAELLSFEDSVRGPWWTNFTMTSTPRNLRKAKTFYVRGQDLASNLDIKTYDTMQINLLAEGDGDDAVGGELWVEYDIQLLTPQRKPEGEALGQKRSETEGEFNSSSGTTISSRISNLMDWDSLGVVPSATVFGTKTPGIYDVTLDTWYNTTPPAWTQPSDVYSVGSYRDCYYSNIEKLKGGYNENASTSNRGIFEVLETAANAASQAFLNIDYTTLSGAASFFLATTELLSNSGRREAYLKSEGRRKWLTKVEEKWRKRCKSKADLRRHTERFRRIWGGPRAGPAVMFPSASLELPSHKEEEESSEPNVQDSEGAFLKQHVEMLQEHIRNLEKK